MLRHNTFLTIEGDKVIITIELLSVEELKKIENLIKLAEEYKIKLEALNK
jgi:hypothetical protein